MATLLKKGLKGDTGAQGDTGIQGDTGVDALVDADITALVDVGAIEAQDVITAGTSLSDFIRQLVLTTFYPTYSAPSFSLTDDQASSLESGTITDIVLTYNFSRGSINGAMDGGIWNPATFQDYRAGAATNYTINSVDNDTSNVLTVAGFEILDGSNTFSGSVTFVDGPQPVDSTGANYGSPYSGDTISSSLTITGSRSYFYGVSNTAADSADIRALANSALSPSNGTTFTIDIPIGATNVVFAYPDTLDAVSSVVYVEGMNAEIKEVFDLSTFNVAGANGYSPIAYKVYVYTPVEAFSAAATYEVTI